MGERVLARKNYQQVETGDTMVERLGGCESANVMDISGWTHLEVFAALFYASKIAEGDGVESLGIVPFRRRWITPDACADMAKWIEDAKRTQGVSADSQEYVVDGVLPYRLSFNGDSVDVSDYEDYNGHGSAEKAMESLREFGGMSFFKGNGARVQCRVYL